MLCDINERYGVDASSFACALAGRLPDVNTGSNHCRAAMRRWNVFQAMTAGVSG